MVIKDTSLIIHFLVGCVISLLVIDISSHKIIGFFLGPVTATIIGILKEIYDLKIKNTIFNIDDLLYTFLGGVVASILVTIIYLIISKIIIQ